MTLFSFLFAVTALFYALACWNSYRYYQALDEVFDGRGIRWLKVGLAVQVLTLSVQWGMEGQAPLTTLSGILGVFSSSLAFALVIGRVKTPVSILMSLFIPFIFLLSLFSFLGSFQASPLESHGMTNGIAIHIILTFLGFSFFTMGFGVGVAFWIQEGQLKQHRIKSWSYRLPALEVLDRLTVFYIGLGFLFWLVGLVLGAFQGSSLPSVHPTILGSFLVLLIYACFFLLRWVFKLRGRKSMVLVMAGYFLALFIFMSVRYFMMNQHPF
jgi:ABC-type uncharacterized transport system permease subunit